MKKEYKKPIAEIFEFQLKDSIMNGNIPGVDISGSVGGIEGEDGWE